MTTNRVPVAHRVLVKIDKIDADEKVSASGLIVQRKLTPTEIKREMASQEEGVVEALGPDAFKAFGDGKDWCKVGDRVFIVKYSGVNFEDEETGDMYRIINDDDIYAVIQSREDKNE